MTDDLQQKKNQRTIIIVALLTIIPFTIAWLLTLNPQWQPSATNKGTLITPVIVTERSDLQGMDEFAQQNIKELQGHWVFLNIITQAHCDQLCADAIHATKQLRLMLNKDLTRSRRAVIMLHQAYDPSYASWWDDDARLLKVLPSAALMDKIKTLFAGQSLDGMLIIMDPLGNLMMYYPAGFDPYAVKSDLQKLLRISQIG